MGAGQPAAAGPAGEDDLRARRMARIDHEIAIRQERYRWEQHGPCRVCGEWIGHWGGPARGDGARPACSLIPLNVPLEEVRPNCFTVLRPWIGDAIRAATARRGAEA